MNNRISDNILALINKTPDALLKDVARRVKERRLEKNLTQKALATKAGVSFGSYRRFESCGEISFRSLVMIAFTLDMTDEFDALFNIRTYRSVDDLLKADRNRQRKRGGHNE